MVLDGDVFGTRSEFGWIVVGESECGLIVFVYSGGDGGLEVMQHMEGAADFIECSAKWDEGSHGSGEGDVFTFHGTECDEFLEFAGPNNGYTSQSDYESSPGSGTTRIVWIFIAKIASKIGVAPNVK